MSPRSTTRPLYFWNIGSGSEFLRWQMSISVAKRTILFSFCFQNDLSVALYIGHLPRWQLFELVPFFVHCCFRIRNFYRLRHRNKLVHLIAVTQRIEPFLRDEICMIFRWTRFQTLSSGFMSCYEACMLCLGDVVGSFGFSVGFPQLVGSLLRPQLYKSIAASIRLSNYSVRFWWFPWTLYHRDR